MGKQRNKWLGDAEIPRSAEQFLLDEQSGLGVRLLLSYLDELEKINKALVQSNQSLSKHLSDVQKRMDKAEDDIQRLNNNRILKKKAEEEADAKAIRPHGRSVHGTRQKGTIRSADTKMPPRWR